jgi:hypothetical protein
MPSDREILRDISSVLKWMYLQRTEADKESFRIREKRIAETISRVYDATHEEDCPKCGGTASNPLPINEGVSVGDDFYVECDHPCHRKHLRFRRIGWTSISTSPRESFGSPAVSAYVGPMMPSVGR